MNPVYAIAHYRITAKLDEGGMGEVWRATDTKLNRDVAIKILPEAFAANRDRLARFTCEAQVLASLNHPNIAAIHGVEERAIIMELVEGQTLAGPMPVDDALPIIHQLIDALEYAHEKGVVHRDLKPANIKTKVYDHCCCHRKGRIPPVEPTLKKAEEIEKTAKKIRSSLRH
jgi:serine/threonine-protein kinase